MYVSLRQRTEAGELQMQQAMKTVKRALAEDGSSREELISSAKSFRALAKNRDVIKFVDEVIQMAETG